MKTELLSGTIMTPIERQQGRYLRAPDHTEGGDAGGESQSGGANNAGNSDDSNAEPKNNGGQDDALAGFWDDPKPKEGEGGDSSKSDDGKDGDKGQSDWAKGLITRLDALKFDDVFTDKVADDIAKGDLTGANERFAQATKEGIRQSVIMSAEVMKQVGANILAEVDRRIGAQLGGRDDDAALKEAFASYSDPEVRPILKQVYAQSLQHTGGDKAKAVAMTRDMMKLVGKKGSKDMGFEAPAGKDDVYMQGAAKSLVEDLLTRTD